MINEFSEGIFCFFQDMYDENLTHLHFRGLDISLIFPLLEEELKNMQSATSSFKF